MKKHNIILFGLLVFSLLAFVNCGEDKATNPIEKPEPEDYDLVSVPASSGFPMGWDGISSDEIPVHTVTLDEFSIGKHEVTYSLYLEVKTWAELNGYTFYRDGNMGWGTDGLTDQHPVTSMWWIDCIAWCNAYSEYKGLDPVYYTTSAKEEYFREATFQAMAGMSNDCVDWTANGFRLPTEAEWEYAARFINSSSISSGAEHSGYNLFPDINDCASYNNNGRTTRPVGALEPNSLGIYDMSGNVREWCWDWYHEDYYTTSPADNPLGPDSGSDAYRSFRGGGASDNRPYCRTSCRIPVEGGSFSSNTSGFRVYRGVVID